MSKIYVVVDVWCRECDNECNVLGTYTDRKAAEKALDKQVKELQADSDFDTEEYVKGDYYEAFNEGYYSEAYDRVFIQESELE